MLSQERRTDRHRTQPASLRVRQLQTSKIEAAASLTTWPGAASLPQRSAGPLPRWCGAPGPRGRGEHDPRTAVPSAVIITPGGPVTGVDPGRRWASPPVPGSAHRSEAAAPFRSGKQAGTWPQRCRSTIEADWGLHTGSPNGCWPLFPTLRGLSVHRLLLSLRPSGSPGQAASVMNVPLG